MMGEEPGKPTAYELFNQRKDDGTFDRLGHYDWTAFCTVGDYCTRPCRECGIDAERAKETATLREASK